MATITASSFSVSDQQDGRRWVTETHIDNVGVSHALTWLADAGANLSTFLANHAAQLALDLAAGEIMANVIGIRTLGSLFSPTFVYSIVADNVSALRTAYQNATRVEAIMIGDFLSSLTDAQLQTAFGLTAAQVTNLRNTKLTPAANTATTIRATTGA